MSGWFHGWKGMPSCMGERSYRAGKLPTVEPHQSCIVVFRAFRRQHDAISQIQCTLLVTPMCRLVFHPAMSTKTTLNQPTTPPASHVVKSWFWPHTGMGESTQTPMKMQMNSASFLLLPIGANLVFSWRRAQPFVHWQPTLVKSQNPIR